MPMTRNIGLTEPQRHPRAHPLPCGLRHQYVVMRHGFSVPNRSQTIVSDIPSGSEAKNGLTDLGREQVLQSAASLVSFLECCLSTKAESSRGGLDIVVVSSPFSRALQTAEILTAALSRNSELVASALRTPSPMVAEELCERYFGELNGKQDTEYAKVWEKDESNGDAQEAFGVESCLSVWRRVRSLVKKLESQLRRPAVVLLVSHGDTLQIAQAGFDASRALCTHRLLPPLKQAEWRILKPMTDCCPVMVAKM